MTLISLVVGFAGIATGGSSLIKYLLDSTYKNKEFLELDIIQGFTLFFVWGMVWYFYWQPRRERDDDELSSGQKLVERIYQYLVVAIGVIGGMVSAASFLNVIIRAILEGSKSSFVYDLVTSVYLLILFIVTLLYHLRFLRKTVKKDDAVKEKSKIEINIGSVFTC